MTAKEYAGVLNVSKNTIYNYLKELKDDFTNLAIDVVLIPSKGIMVHHDISVKVDRDLDLSSLEYRRFFLFLMIMIKNEPVSISNFASSYFVSQSSIYADVTYISDILKDVTTSSLKIVDGIITHDFKSEDDLVSSVLYVFDHFSDILGEDELNDVISKSLDPIDRDKISELVHGFLASKNYRFADHYVDPVITLLTIMIYRSYKGKQIDVALEDYVEAMTETFVLRRFIDDINNGFGISLNHDCIVLLYSYLKAIPNLLDDKDIKMHDEIIYQEIIDMIAKIFDLKVNTIDLEHFLLHIRTMTYRLRNNVIVKNQLLEAIRHECAYLFFVVDVLFASEEKKLGITLSEDEKAFLVLHLQNIINQNDPHRTVIVYSKMGRLVEDYILGILSSHYSSPFIHYASYSPELIHDASLLVTDDDIKTDIPTLKVSSVLKKSDIYAYIEKMQVHFGKKPKADIFIRDTSCKDKDEVIANMNDQLINDHIISPDTRLYMTTSKIADRDHQLVIADHDNVLQSAYYIVETNDDTLVFINIKKDDLSTLDSLYYGLKEDLK